MPGLLPPIIGRDDELTDIRHVLEDPLRGPSLIVLEGLAGIGKTAIWKQVVQDALAMGTAVRTARCSEPDAGWAFAGLGDILEGLPRESLAELPAVQRSALSAALLLSEAEGGAPGERVVGVAVLGVLRALARSGPVVIAIDDIQWLDPSSSKVLAFAMKRLVDEPVLVVATRRTERVTEGADASELGLQGQRIVVGGVSVGILQQIVLGQLHQTLARRTLTKIHDAAGGNPMACLEMARALLRRGSEPEAGEPLPVPADLRALVTGRLRGLSEESRDMLLIAGALAHPTLASVTAAMGRPPVSERCIREVIEAGIVELDGQRVRFTHPLMASIPYADLAPEGRRGLHRRLAETVADPEEQARHAALGSVEPDPAVADALDIAARRARARGSIDAAAELAELALARTPTADQGDLLRRTVVAAKHLFLLGDTERARITLTAGLSVAAPGPLRVPGLLLQATIASWEEGDATVVALCDQAISEAGEDVTLLALCYATLAETSPSGAAMDMIHAERAVDLLGRIHAPAPELLANALTNLACNGCRLGRGLDVATLERAVALQAGGDPVPVSERAGMGLGMYLKVIDRFDESRSWLTVMLTAAVDEGDDSALPITLGHLATLECWAGDYLLGLRYATEGRAHAARMGVRAPMPQSAHVLALAHLGRLDEARAAAERDIAEDEALGYHAAVALHLRSLGVVELMAGDARASAELLLRALTISSTEIGIGEPAILRLHGDAVAALVDLGRLDEGWQLADDLEAATERTHLPWSTAIGARCRGLLKAAEGDRSAAVELFRQAVIDHRLLPMPFEEARTRLLLGRALQRSGHRNDARHELESARETFARLGTPIQAQLASTELANLGGWPGRDGNLTPVEQRIATLVAAGQTNKEVAGDLFLSVRTVESHLTRIYRKLDLRSRTELARRLPG